MSTLSVASLQGTKLTILDQQDAAILPSAGTSLYAETIARSINGENNNQLTSSFGRGTSKSRSTATLQTQEAKLFQSLANAKLMTSTVAMHLEQNWRRNLFGHLDRLLDVDAWHEDDIPLVKSSFYTFLRFLVFVRPQRQPALGINDNGDLIAGWSVGTDTLQIECLPNDMIRWIVNCDVDGEPERAVGDSFVARMPTVLAPYSPERWFKIG
jgi:hypothetical protein